MDWFLIAGWTVYGLLHSWLASASVKWWFRQRLGRYYRFYRLGYSVLALVLILPLLWLARKHPPIWLWRPGFLQQVPGWLMLVSGSAMAVKILSRYVSSAAGFRDLFLEGETPALQTTGWHGRVRHPLYLFTFVAIWGYFLVRPTTAVLISDLCITAYTLLGIRWEEKKLLRVYGQDYADYRMKVPMIIPFLY